MLYIFLICLLTLFNNSFCSHNSAPTKSINSTTAYDYEENYIFNALTFPLSDITDSFTLNIFSQINTTFGPNGLDYNEDNIELIKKAYLYLIFLTKLELVVSNPKFTQYQEAFGDLSSYKHDVMPLLPTKKIVTSSGWHSIQISATDIQNSLAWQLFCKAQVTDAYAYFIAAIDMIHNAEKDIFNYIPHIETSYYDYDFTQLKTLNEICRIKIILENKSQEYFLKQTSDWSKLPVYADQKSKDNKTIDSFVTGFKQTTFYQNSHNIYKLLGISNNAKITTKNLLSPTKMQTPEKECIWNFFFLNEVLTFIYGTMNKDTLEKTLSLCSNSKLTPNIFPYTLDDYIYFDDLLSLKSTIDGSANESSNPSAPKTKLEKHVLSQPDHKQVQVQWWPADWIVSAADAVAHTAVKIGDSIAAAETTAWSDVKNAVDDSWDAVKNLGEAVGDGIAGLAVSTVGHLEEFFTGGAAGQSLINWGNAEQAQAVKDLQKSTIDLQNTIDDLTSAIENGTIAPFASITGNVVSLITDDKELGETTSEVIDQVGDAITEILAEPYALSSTALADSAVGMVELTTTVVNLISTTVSSISDPGDAGKNWKSLIDLTIQEITSSFTGLLRASKANIEAIIKALTAITNSITSIIVNIIREITYLGALGWNLTIGGLEGTTFSQALANADQERDKVTHTLNQHRQVINQVVGVALGIGLTVATMGAGSEAAIAEVTAEEAAAEITENISEIAENIFDETGVEASEEDVDQAIDNGIEKTAQKVAQKTGKKLTEKTLNEVKAATRKFIKDEMKKASQKVVEQEAEKLGESPEDILSTTDPSLLNPIEQAAEAEAKAIQESPEDILSTAIDTLLNPQEEAEDILSTTHPSLLNPEEIEEAEDILSTTHPSLLNPEEEPGEIPDEEPGEKPSEKPDEDNTDAIKKAKMIKVALTIALNSAFGVFNVLSGLNSDNENSFKELEEAEQLKALWKFINENKLSTGQAVSAMLEELEAKQTAEIGNQIINLALSQNLLNQQVNQFVQETEKAVAKNYIQQLTPNKTTELIPANIGTSWALQTNYIDLFPTEGLTSTTAGRPEFPFAQEIAQAPEITYAATKVRKASKQSTLWLNQKSIAFDAADNTGKTKSPTDPLTVSIDLQFLYLLNSEFYVGLYLGGTYHDYTSTSYLTNLEKTNTVDLNADNLSKAVILYREKATDPISLGVYEYQGKEWILQEVLPTPFQLSNTHTYQLQANLNGSTIDMSLMVDNDSTTKITKQVNVTDIDNQRTYGIIYSGAAIQWNQFTPIPENKVASSARPSNNPPTVPTTSEIKREQQSKKLFAESMNPTFGSIKLQALSKQAVICSQYLYSTTDTNLNQFGTKLTTDYLLFGQMTTDQDSGETKFSKVGMHPPVSQSNDEVNPNIIISVISGNVYDEKGHTVGHLPFVCSAYSQHITVSQAIANYIKSAQQAVITKLSTYTFGSFKLLALSTSDIKDGKFVYTCNQTLNLLDSEGKTLPDYVILVENNDNTLGNLIGLSPFSSNATGMLSLVSGNLYAKTTVVIKGQLPTPIDTALYTNYITSLSEDDQALITKAQAAYTALQKEEKEKKKPKTKIVPSQKTKQNSLNPQNANSGISLHPSSGIHLGPPATHSISSLRNKNAANSGFHIGPASKGINLKPHGIHLG